MSNHAYVNNIFIFLHELIWWSPTNEYQNVKINYAPHYPGSTNFDSIVKPLLLTYSNNITLYAGDLGCVNSVSSYMYDHFNNITLIGSGMGGGARDNIIITDVYGDSVYYNLVAINGSDPKALGEIYDFKLNISQEVLIDNSISIFPNPVINDFFIIGNQLQTGFKLNIFDLNGRLMYTGYIQKNCITRIEKGILEQGIYIIRGFNNDYFFSKKIIIR